MIIYRFIYIYMSIWPHVSSCFSFRQVTPWKPHPRASAAPPPRAVGTWSQWPHRPWAPHQWRGETATVASGRVWWPAQQEMATGKWGTLTSWPGKLGVFKAKMLGKWSDSEGGWVWKLVFFGKSANWVIFSWVQYNLVGGWATPLNNISQLGWWHSQCMKKKCSKPPTSNH